LPLWLSGGADRRVCPPLPRLLRLRTVTTGSRTGTRAPAWTRSAMRVRLATSRVPRW